MKARRPSRRHGLQRPLSSPQIVVLILYPLITACFFALAAEGMLPAEQAPAVLGVHAVAVALAVASWAACTLLDPREEGSCFCPCMALTQREYRPKYCPDCRKVVPGLDHHCVWLNTCIGTRTYGAFYTLAAAGTAQFAVQTVSGVLMLTKWSDTLPKWGSGGAMREPALAAHAASAALLFCAFSTLLAFHTYLVVRGAMARGQGIGTYDWLLLRARTRAGLPADDGAKRHARGQLTPKPASAAAAVESEIGRPGKRQPAQQQQPGAAETPEEMLEPRGAHGEESAVV